jgi:serine/threonine-protein kinase
VTVGLDEAVGEVIDAVHAGQAAGHIRDDVAVDLINLLRQLSNAPARDVSRRVAELQQKIRDRSDEGSLARAAATDLQNRLDRIAQV